MSFLIYCIFAKPAHPDAEMLRGIGGQPVEIVSHNGLFAAVSSVQTVVPGLDIGTLKCFENVVATFFARQAVIPLRYGSVVREKDRIVRHLDKNAPRYRALLTELEGCVEMGIRILMPDNGLPQKKTHDNFVRKPDNPGSGGGYLMQRKAVYDAQDQESQLAKRIAQEFRSLFSGVFVKYKWETAEHSSLCTSRNSKQPGSRDFAGLISLFFLVPVLHLQRFKEIFHRASSRKHARMMLSGPWPPYSFVVGDSTQHLK
jgi:hypothetical protein